MYSKNDYRYYLEHRLEESDDYLAHYGVKGMKWHKHKKSRAEIADNNDPKIRAGKERLNEQVSRLAERRALARAQNKESGKRISRRMDTADRNDRKMMAGKEHQQERVRKKAAKASKLAERRTAARAQNRASSERISRRMDAADRNDPKMKSIKEHKQTRIRKKEEKATALENRRSTARAHARESGVKITRRMNAADRNDPKLRANAARKAERRRRMNVADTNDYKIRSNRQRKSRG